MKNFSQIKIIFLTSCYLFANLSAQNTITRPPAIPLITSSPYFSIWSFADNPLDDYTKHWTGSTMSVYSMINIDGKVYRILGVNIGGSSEIKFNTNDN